MYWLRRPPYLRWVAASVVLVFGMWIDLRSSPTVSYPFAETPISAGSPISSGLEWREVPSGLLPTWVLPSETISAVDIDAGEPVLRSHLGEAIVPVGWWKVALTLPEAVAPGTQVRVVLSDGSIRDGVTAGAVTDDGYQLRGTVAFPSEHAPLVAKAAADDALVVMVAAGGDGAQLDD